MHSLVTLNLNIDGEGDIEATLTFMENKSPNMTFVYNSMRHDGHNTLRASIDRTVMSIHKVRAIVSHCSLV